MKGPSKGTGERSRRPIAASLMVTVAVTVLNACSGGGNASTAAMTPSPEAAMGKTLFFDVNLSASGQQSCGTCHSPAHAFAAADGASVPLGGPHMSLPGLRNAPSLMYASFTPPFNAEDVTGGFFRDGRSSTLATQAAEPFVTPFEMANADAAEVVQRIKTRPYLQQFIDLHGAAALDDPETALTDIATDIAKFESQDESFHPFTSKFDYWQSGKAKLTTQEANGLALFNNPGKGNCTACHPSQRQQYSEHPLFTDFSYDNIGIPRNWKIAANAATPVSPVDGAPLDYVPKNQSLPADAEYSYYDMGVCGPLNPSAPDSAARPDFTRTTTLCGVFKVPTLRNVAVTAPYFHNGVFDTLREAVQWYVTRDINSNTDNNPIPSSNPYSPTYLGTDSFYVAADGTPDALQYNDLPVDFDANVNIVEIPYTPPTFQGGQAPTLTSDEIDDVVAFLCTLTDGFDPANPTAYALPAQCTTVGASVLTASTNH